MRYRTDKTFARAQIEADIPANRRGIRSQVVVVRYWQPRGMSVVKMLSVSTVIWPPLSLGFPDSGQLAFRAVDSRPRSHAQGYRVAVVRLIE
ncbi:hypothetical protein GCM10007071_10930 [Marinobacter zhanjiangensis]|uniref:Uncharacterized protein n=1 Tax=Marinobacter zhanjiangensis TaxID=578215 RepID=A0ABQ3AUR2_9GAMM|nr:hypothetical protein GCM10007071_10930 [Marinobacter zhanjiangensis]